MSEERKTGWGEQTKCYHLVLFHIYRLVGAVSEAVTAPLLQDTDTSGSDPPKRVGQRSAKQQEMCQARTKALKLITRVRPEAGEGEHCFP